MSVREIESHNAKWKNARREQTNAATSQPHCHTVSDSLMEAMREQTNAATSQPHCRMMETKTALMEETMNTRKLTTFSSMRSTTV